MRRLHSSRQGVTGNKRALWPFLVLTLFLHTSFVGKYHNALSSVGIKTIVIDAGHGGKDPGCHGASLREKDVCLSIALKLGKSIRENFKDVKIIYTRKTDVFVELHERAAIANRNKADLFICIHANSGQPKAKGVETYVMGLHKSEANLLVAKRENSAIFMESDYDKNYQDFDGSPEAIIAMSIAQAEYLDQSMNFASEIQKQFKKLGRKDRGVKQAGFLVLYRTTMPSVLVEAGFLTNKEEEKWLADKQNQEQMAVGIFKAFVAYKTEIDSINQTMNDGVYTAPVMHDGAATRHTERTDTKNHSSHSDSRSGIVFKVQIITSASPIARKPKNFKGLTEVDEYISSGMYKYTVGRKATFKEAKVLRKEMGDKGYNGAFIVAFKEGKRINLQEAIRLTQE